MKILLLVIAAVLAADPEIEEEELRARVFLQHVNVASLRTSTKSVTAQWNYSVNLTEFNKRNMLAVAAEVSEERKKYWQEVVQFNWRNFKDYDVRRQFKFLSILGPDALPEDKVKKRSKIISDMEEIYSTAKICDFKNSSNCQLALSPELEDILSTSEDPEELKHVWTEWRNAVGPKVKHIFKEYVELSNQAAQLNNFGDTGDYWVSDYDTDDIKEQVENLWVQLKPLYVQLHAYVRHQLRGKYGELVSEKGPIPAHLLGNMWAQTWDHIYETSKPHPEKKEVSVTEEMIKQQYDYIKIFKTAEDFFVSLNLSAMPESFWKNSVLQKLNDTEMVCHASAWDFYDGKNFWIKQCTKIVEEDLITAHHEMGHIQYFMQYSNQPAIYREGANEGFHEAIGDVISLSVQTNKHLKKIGLKNSPDNPESELNNLYRIGLSKIAFLPFGYIMDLWRWDVFAGKITPSDYNCKWWKLVEDYQGVEPPNDRTEKDFDPASKYHIVADVPYLRYFVSFIIQFQFHKGLCIKAGEYDPNDPAKPLHKCDIYGSKEAGNVLGQVLRMGKSRPWQDAMEVMTGQRNMDASGLLEYFKPLSDWLIEENKKNGVFVGWEPSKRVCVKSKRDLTGRQQ